MDGSTLVVCFLNDAADEDKLVGCYLDSGAIHHMTGRRDIFSDLDTLVRGTVKFGDASRVEIQGVGSVVFQVKNGEHRVLHGVYFIPALCNSIMSLGQLDEAGSKVEIEDGVLCIQDRRGCLLAKVKCGLNRLFILRLDAVQPVCLTSQKDDDVWRWHERFGHLHFEALNRLDKQAMAQGVPVIEHAKQVYDTCVTTKMRRRPFPQKATYRACSAQEVRHACSILEGGNGDRSSFAKPLTDQRLARQDPLRGLAWARTIRLPPPPLRLCRLREGPRPDQQAR